MVKRIDSNDSNRRVFDIDSAPADLPDADNPLCGATVIPAMKGRRGRHPGRRCVEGSPDSPLAGAVVIA
jgi:hypothetical protein